MHFSGIAACHIDHLYNLFIMFSIKPKLKTKPSQITSNCCVGDKVCVCRHCYYHNPESKDARVYLDHLIRRELEERRLKVEDEVIQVQSGSEQVSNVKIEDTCNETEMNLEFSDAVQQYSLVIGDQISDPTFGMSKVGDADGLEHFLERPVEIFSKTWQVGESPAYVNEINPWVLFLNNSRVLNKLETFKLLQGNLNIKIMVNGSPFHYGRMFFGVRPSVYDNNPLNIGPKVQLVSPNFHDQANSDRTMPCMQSLYSQRPHVFIDPSTNQPQHITWPFFAAGNNIDLMQSFTFRRMGVIEIWELNSLAHANGATDPVEITMFAWMSNVKLAGLSQGTVTPQSGVRMRKSKNKPKFTAKSGADEYSSNGLISAPATTLASYANYFTEIPYIGAFAKATNIAASAVAGVAKIFGYSRPPILTDTMFVRPQPMGNLANTTGADPLMKLSLDPKQELTIDPATLGLPADDEMSFAYLLKKEAWIDTFNWNLNTTQAEGRIYSLLLHPHTSPSFYTPVVGDDGGNAAHTKTPVGFVAEPFEYWTGSLRVRFQIVCSQFHRGRLMFVYEPTPWAEGTNVDTNNRFVHVIDIAEERDVTFEVNWTQEDAYRRVQIGPFNHVSRLGSVSGFPNIGYTSRSNGVLQVYVVNQLAAPTDSANVSINVYMSAGDSFEVKAPNDINRITYSRLDEPAGPPALAQSGVREIVTPNENMPEQDSMYILNGNYKTLQLEQSQVYFGEHIVSFRSLMKRYIYHRSLDVTVVPSPPAGGAVYLTEFVVRNLPNGPGLPYGSSVGGTLTPVSGAIIYNICAMTYIRYVMSAYVGYRGGLRWKVAAYTQLNDSAALRVSRASASSIETSSQTLLLDSTTTRSQLAQRFLANGEAYSYSHGGSSEVATDVNPVLEYEIPFYHRYRYAECNGAGTVSGNNLEEPCHVINVTAKQNDNNSLGWLEFNSSIGEDFSLFFFIGAPPTMSSDVTSVTPV